MESYMAMASYLRCMAGCSGTVKMQWQDIVHGRLRWDSLNAMPRYRTRQAAVGQLKCNGKISYPAGCGGPVKMQWQDIINGRLRQDSKNAMARYRTRQAAVGLLKCNGKI